MASSSSVIEQKRSTENDRGINRAKPKSRHLPNVPPEIWIKIGRLVVDNTPLVTRNNIWYFAYAKRERREQAGLLQPAITQVCKALRLELLPYYYKTRIEGYEWSLMDNDVGKWLKRIGRENRKHIQAIAVGMWEADKSYACSKANLRREWGIEVDIEANGVPIEGWAEYTSHRVTLS